MIRILLSAVLLLFFAGCGPRYGDYFAYHDDGSLKPHVVILPIKDCTGNCELAEELMGDIRDKIMCNGNLYVYSECSINDQMQKCGISDTSFFSTDLNYARKFGGADFVVSLELVECRSDRYGEIEDKCMPLHLRCKDQFRLNIRMRVIDLRCKEPVIVLQELFGRSYLHPYRREFPEQVDRSCFNRLCNYVSADFVQRLEHVCLK